MKPSQALEQYREQIKQIISSHRAINARVFGSVVRGEDSESSDLDILVDPTPETSLMDLGAIQVELMEMLNIRVDILTPKALPDSFRKQVLKEAIPL